MKMLQILFLVSLLNGCSEEVANFSEDLANEEAVENSVDVYDESSIATVQEALISLLSEGDFESQEDWRLCGDAKISSENQQSATNNYLSLSTSSRCEELSDDFIDVNGFVYHPFALSEIPEKLYITFDARTTKEILSYTFDTNFKVGFLDERFFSTEYYGAVDFINYFKSQLDESWSRIEIIADKEAITAGLGEGILPEYIFIELGSSENMTLDIDNLTITTSSFTTQAAPMPNTLKENLADDKIIFTNIDENSAAIADINGSNMIILSDISTEVLSSYPTWYNKENLLLADKNFNPPNSSNGTTISAAQSKLYRVSFDGNQELLYETLGHPGVYEYDGSVNNRDALDIEIDRTFWNKNLNLGLITICAQNRGLGFVSDDYCKLVVIDENGNEIATMREEDTGFHGVWSSNGKIAYVWYDKIFTAEIQGAQIVPTLVHTTRSGLKGAVEWSPNNRQLAFIEYAGKFIEFNGQQIYANAIKVLDLTTGQKKEITLVDFGDIDPMLSWSNNGEYIFYSVQLAHNKQQIWWAEVATGDTGPITNTINAFAATVLKK